MIMNFIKKYQFSKKNGEMLNDLAHKREINDLHGFTKLFNDYLDFNSTPIDLSQFKGNAAGVVVIINKLKTMGVEVKVTHKNFLYLYGVHAGSCLGKTVMTGMKSGGIYLDLVPIHKDMQLLDTICHEAIHATGPLLGRMDPTNQVAINMKAIDHEYVFEEYVAIYGASLLLEKLQIMKSHTRETMGLVMGEICRQGNFNGTLDGDAAELSAKRAVELLINPHKVHLILQK